MARNRPPGTPAFGIGSHCDSNRNGGRYDGRLAVVAALETCRLNPERGLDLPLQVLGLLEEEGSGFGHVLSGSRIMAGLISEAELAHIHATDDDRTFLEHARAAGFDPDRWGDSIHVLDDLVGWNEVHIEQCRGLQDTGHQLGLGTRSPATCTATLRSKDEPTMLARRRWICVWTPPSWPHRLSLSSSVSRSRRGVAQSALPASLRSLPA